MCIRDRNKTATVTVDLKQKQADWQSMDPVNIRGIIHYKMCIRDRRMDGAILTDMIRILLRKFSYFLL